MSPSKPRSIRWSLGALVAAVAVPLLALLLWLYGSQVHRERQDAREAALRLAKSTATRIRALHRDSLALLQRMAARPAIRDFDGKNCDSLFAIIDFFPQYATLFLFDRNDALVCSAEPQAEDRGISARALDWINGELKQDRLRNGIPMIRQIDAHWVSILSVPVTAKDGSHNGTLVLVQLPEVGEETLPSNTVVTILDASGTIVARSNDGEHWSGRNVRGAGVTDIALKKKEGIADAVGVDGVPRQYGFTYLPETGWHIYAGIATAVVMQPVRELFVRGVIAGIVIIAVVLAVAAIFSRAIARPLGVKMAADERQLKALSDRLLVVQEEERSRIARELHDDLGQSLTALKMDIIGLLQSPDTSAATSIRERIMKTVDATVTSVQRISSELRPSILDDLGLVATIESEARLFEERTGVECELSLPEEFAGDRTLSTVIYRIVQEALTNVARHSNASRVEIRLRQRVEGLVLEIRDDGRGVTANEVDDPGSLGLIGIRERAALVGGTAQFEGIEGHGTIVSVRIPSGL